MTPVSQMKPMEKVFLGVVALVGFVNLGVIGTIARSIYIGSAVGTDVFNGVILALLLQAVLVNTVFVWRIMDSLETIKEAKEKK